DRDVAGPVVDVEFGRIADGVALVDLLGKRDGAVLVGELPGPVASGHAGHEEQRRGHPPVAPPARREVPIAGVHRPRSSTRRPVPGTTSPMWRAPGRAASTSSASPGATMRTRPMPMLKTSYISSRSTSPRCSIRRKIPGTGQA